MPDKTKDDLLNYLNNIRVPFLLCYPSKNFLNSDMGLKYLKQFSMIFDGENIQYLTLATTLQNVSKRKESLDGFEGVFLKTVTTDALEALKAYCKRTNQLNLLKSQPWFQFFRLVRNCFSHDYFWQFRPDDIKLLPITYRGKTITKEMENTVIRFEFYNVHVTWRLLRDAVDFVKNDLN